MRSFKEECLECIIIVGQGSLRRAVREYDAHYRGERSHQWLENRLLKPVDQARGQNGNIALMHTSNACAWIIDADQDEVAQYDGRTPCSRERRGVAVCRYAPIAGMAARDHPGGRGSGTKRARVALAPMANGSLAPASGRL